MKTFGEFIKEKRKKLKMSLRVVAEKADVTPGHIAYIEKDERKPTLGIAMNILIALNVDMDEFLHETGYSLPKAEPPRVPLVSWETANKWHEIQDVFETTTSNEWIECDLEGMDFFALMVKDDSMEPEFHEGDIVIIDPNLKTKPDDYIIAKDGGSGEATFRQLKKYGNTFVLHPLNPHHHDKELDRKFEQVVIGKIIEKKKRYLE